MKSHDQNTRPIADELEWRETEAAEMAAAQGRRRRSPARIVRVSTLALIAIIATYALFGCGRHRSQEGAQSTSTDQSLVVAQPAGTNLPPAPSGTQTASPEATGESRVATSADAVPPEVEASIADSLVLRGNVIQVTAQGSADVVSVSLKDDLGTEQPMTYDSTSQVWRAFYRVPLKVRSDRVALSVTAKNAGSRWRRVWLFLDVQYEAGKEPVGNPEK